MWRERKKMVGELSLFLAFLVNFRDRRQILLPTLSKFNRINQVLLSLKSSEKHRLSNDFRRNGS